MAGIFDMFGPMSGGTGGASNQDEFERMQFIKDMLAQLQSGEAKSGSTFTPPAPTGPATGYGAGSKEMTPELVQALGMPSAPVATDPLVGMQGRLGELTPEQLDQLEQMLSMRMNMLARRGF